MTHIDTVSQANAAGWIIFVYGSILLIEKTTLSDTAIGPSTFVSTLSERVLFEIRCDNTVDSCGKVSGFSAHLHLKKQGSKNKLFTYTILFSPCTIRFLGFESCDSCGSITISITITTTKRSAISR